VEDVSTNPKSKSEYVRNVNQLNEDFSERIGKLNNADVEGSTSKTVEVVNEEVELNENKKRVLINQKGRDSSDSE
jgi:hypothetical protein